MKQIQWILVFTIVVGIAVPAFGEVISGTSDMQVPENCGAPYVQNTDECSQCHTLDFGGAEAFTMNQPESVTGDPVTYRIVNRSPA